MKICVAIALSVLSVCAARADQLDDANFRNAVELIAYSKVCKSADVPDLIAAYRRYATKAGVYTNHQIDKTAATRAKAARHESDFCKGTNDALPVFRMALENNDPATNPAVPNNVIQRAQDDCGAAVYQRNTDFGRKLYSDCVQQQIDIWMMQDRYRQD